MAKTAPEIIALHLGWNMPDVTEGRCQKYTSPGVYVCGNDYFCCPTASQKLPKGVSEKPWEIVGTYYGRTVWRVQP